MLRPYIGRVMAVDFGDYADANTARHPSTSYYYDDATVEIDESPWAHIGREGEEVAHDITVRCSDGSYLAKVECCSPDAALTVQAALATLDGPTLALTLGLLWSMHREIYPGPSVSAPCADSPIGSYKEPVARLQNTGMRVNVIGDPSFIGHAWAFTATPCEVTDARREYLDAVMNGECDGVTS